MQADRGLAGAGRALDAQGRQQRCPDQVVLVRLDGRDDVPHRAGPGALDLGRDQRADLVRRTGAVERLVLVGGQLGRLGEPVPPPQPHPHRIVPAGPVERCRHRRPPVHYHRVAVRVPHVPAPDVDPVGAGGAGPVDEPAEEQCHPRGGRPARARGGRATAGRRCCARSRPSPPRPAAGWRCRPLRRACAAVPPGRRPGTPARPGVRRPRRIRFRIRFRSRGRGRSWAGGPPVSARFPGGRSG